MARETYLLRVTDGFIEITRSNDDYSGPHHWAKFHSMTLPGGAVAYPLSIVDRTVARLEGDPSERAAATLALVRCMRQSAQTTLDALEREGFTIIRKGTA